MMDSLGTEGKRGGYVPRLVQALVGKKVIGAAAGCLHTAVWTLPRPYMYMYLDLAAMVLRTMGNTAPARLPVPNGAGHAHAW
jgi:hypothetical protein